MDEYYTSLWTDKEDFDIKPHKTLKDAITYLVKNGARFENQEIFKKVSWLPKEDAETILEVPAGSKVRTISKDPEEEALAKKPNPTGPPVEQPQVIDATKTSNISKNLEGKKSIFDGIIPPQLRGPIINDSD